MFSRKTAITALVGFVLGIITAIVARPYLGQNLQEAVSGKRESVSGLVTAKQRQGDRLLLTIVTRDGASLATFEKMADEINLLVEEGDTVALGLRGGYEPFLQDPDIRGVRKPPFHGGPVAAEPDTAAAVPDTAPATEGLEGDTLGAKPDTLNPAPASRWYD